MSIEQIADVLRGADSVLLVAHVNPDADALGSALATAIALESLGVPVRVTFPDDPFEVPPGLHFLPRQDLLVGPQIAQAAVVMSMDASSPDRIGRLRVILFGWSFYALVYLGFALSRDMWQVGILWALYGLYYAMTEGAIKSLVADLTPSAQRGAGYGWLNGTIGLMALPASLIAGFLWQTIAPSAAFLFGALMAVVAIVLISRMRGMAISHA